MNPLQPKPFCINPQNIKAFVLGCDPTAFDKNQKRLEFEFVFNLDKDQRYFSSILNNLNAIGLTLQDIYVQNLITDYQEKETSRYKNWFIEAKNYIKPRREEFDEKNPTGEIPVLLTSEYLYRVLLKKDVTLNKADELYNLRKQIPIAPDTNCLNRPLIPLYRHRKYALKNWPVYSEKLTKFFYK